MLQEHAVNVFQGIPSMVTTALPVPLLIVPLVQLEPHRLVKLVWMATLYTLPIVSLHAMPVHGVVPNVAAVANNAHHARLVSI